MTMEICNVAIEALLPQRILNMLQSCPSAGAGVHNWVIRVAVRLHAFFHNKDDIADLIRKYSSNCGREVSDREIWDAINSSEKWLARKAAIAGTIDSSYSEWELAKASSPTKWPERNAELIETIAKAGPSLDELNARSPVRMIEGALQAEEIVGILFPKGSLICVGETQGHFKTGPLEFYQRLNVLRRMQFIVPSPMSSREGHRESDGKLSAHTKENTGPRRFLVIEFDQGAADQHAAVLWHLSQREPLVLVVHSGGKSLHGWFYCQDQEEVALLELMKYAVSLGADPATWTKSQFVRLPGGLRDNGKRQRVLYYDPKPIKSQ